MPQRFHLSLSLSKAAPENMQRSYAIACDNLGRAHSNGVGSRKRRSTLPVIRATLLS
jgi:hypothetical protein